MAPQGKARVAFNLTLPDTPADSRGGTRMLAAETATLQVTIQTSGQADVVNVFTPTAAQAGAKTASVVFETSVGTHNLIFRGMSASGRVLTASELNVDLIAGNNNLSVTVTPPDRLTLGTSYTLAVGEVAYYTIPASLNASVLLSGKDSEFWECAADGSFSDGSVGAFLVVPSGSSDRFLRVKQKAAGSFTVLVFTEPVNTTFTPLTAFKLKVGSSSIYGPQDTTMKLTWSNPGAQLVTLYRADALAGPYSAIYSGTGDRLTDATLRGLKIATTYYYAIAEHGGTLENLTSTDLVGSLDGVKHPHFNPVPGVVSGTTLNWDSETNAPIPVVGVPYLAPPPPNQVPAAGIGGWKGPWLNPELPTTAVLAGGYTYWVWGNSAAGEDGTMIAAVDSAGLVQRTFTWPGKYRHVTALVSEAPGVSITTENGTVHGGWNKFEPDLNWFETADVTIDFTIPLNPVVNLNGLPDFLDKGYMESASVSALYPEGWFIYEWRIDNMTVYPDEYGFSIYGDMLVIDSTHLEAGPHQVTVTVTDGVHGPYDASFNLVVGYGGGQK